METTTFFTGALAVLSLIFACIYFCTIKIYNNRLRHLRSMAEAFKDAANKHKAECQDMREKFTASSVTCHSLKKANEDLRDKVRIQAEKALSYKIEIESLRSGKPMYEKRIKSAKEDKPQAIKKPNNRGKNIRGADGKWVKNIGQTVEKKTPPTLGL